MTDPCEFKRYLLVSDSDIDRLVDGELPDDDRRVLLRRFETEPDGWRRCALAFLEAQSWREALVPLATTMNMQPATSALQVRPIPHSWRSVARQAALAASLLVTFALGWLLHRMPERSSVESAVAHLDRKPVEQQPLVTSSVLNHDAQLAPAADQFAEMSSVIKQLDRRSYRAETQTRLATVKSKDGQKVEIPVQEVRFRFVGNRTY
jgi:anti-sigma factor RsiW